MRLLVTADFQADFENLDLCERSWEFATQLCLRRQLDCIIVLGDLKRAYNPVDVRVTQFWSDAVAKARDKNIFVHLLLGNHDRVGMYADAQNWFPILARAGAKVFDDAAISGPLHYLPYTTQYTTWKERAVELAKQARPQSDILFFHQDLSGAYYNMLNVKAEGKFQPEDLHYKTYRYCIGGHIHRYQAVRKNVFYVGSPFTTDWGEANQTKGFLIVTDEGIEFVRSPIPGWYDPEWPGFKAPRDWSGCRIRIKVPVAAGADYSKALDAARLRAEKTYQGAIVHVVPKISNIEAPDVVLSATDPDEKKISSYVDQTLPDDLRADQSRVKSYLCYKVAKASGGRLMRKALSVQFTRAFGKNFLCYKKVSLNYDNAGGLVLVTGRNLDWPGGKSNGSGKSSLLSLLPVALFGSTFKGQKYDAWASRDSDEPSSVSLSFQDYKGRRITVRRGRRPAALRLIVNGIDQSSGLGAAAVGKDGTQGLIEQLCGFTWSTLSNSVYIDQNAVSTFLTGAPRERKQTLERLQNLERFVAAGELVKADLAALVRRKQDLDDELALVGLEVSNCQETLASLPKSAGKKEKELRVAYMASSKVLAIKQKQVDLAKTERKTTLAELDALARSISRSQGLAKRAVDNYNAEAGQLTKEIDARRGLTKVRSCPTCGRHIHVGALEQVIANLQRRREVLQKVLSEAECNYLELADKLNGVEDRIAGVERQRDRQIVVLQDLASKVKEKLLVWNQWRRYAESESGRRRIWLGKLAKAKLRQCRLLAGLQHYEQDTVFLRYCVEALSRDGLPAYLNQQLCPMLNKAADYYSELFCDRHIQVRFAVQNGEFEIEVVNAYGGKTVDDQSAGEQKMAALITVFALREAAPQCNVLILDEPGDGLDPQNARAFAAGIRQLKDRFGTILLTSHNPHVLGELSGERVIQIEKKNGVAEVVA